MANPRTSRRPNRTSTARAAAAVARADRRLWGLAASTRRIRQPIAAAASVFALTLLALVPVLVFPGTFLEGPLMRFGVTPVWGVGVLLAAAVTVVRRGHAAPAGSERPSEQPAGTTPPPRGTRIVIISASIGAGHDGAAAQLAHRLSQTGLPVDRHDFLDLFPARLGHLVSAFYHRLLLLAPGLYQRIYATTDRSGTTGPLARALLNTTRRRLLRALPPDTAAVVATYPGASQILGALRRTGRLTVPVLTYLTDLSVHPLWVADGVDAHLAAHTIPADQARAQGASRVTVAGPVVDPRFTPATTEQRRAARDRFNLPHDQPLALLVAGSWGVGALQLAATEIRDSGAAVPVVVCGRNESLAARLRAAGFEHVHGWTNDMPGLMRAADILVQNAGGLTSLEAFASGLPAVTYRCIPGHGQTNAAALEQAGLAPWIRHPDQLGDVLTGLLDPARAERQRAAGLALFRTGTDPAQVIARTATTATPGTAPARSSSPSRRLRRPIAIAAAALAGITWLGTGGTEIAVAYAGFDTLNTHHTARAYLVVHAPADGNLTPGTLRELAAAHAAIAVDVHQAAADPAEIRRLSESGLTLVNAGFGPPYATGLIAGRDAIDAGATALHRITGVDPAYYLSSNDLDALDLALARHHHERIVVPDLRLSCDGTGPAPRPGQAVLLDCGTATPEALDTTLHHLLADTGPTSTPLGSLPQLHPRTHH